jgi:hypothetical protein
MTKMVSVSIVKVLQETRGAYKVLYAHFENPVEFAVVWLPKSQVVPSDLCSWQIPLWLKNKIASAKRYKARTFWNVHNMPSYAYGFGPYYDHRGVEINLSGSVS